LQAGRASLTVEGVTLDRVALSRACAAHARELEAHGVRSGDRVAVWTERAIETPVALLGNALAGVVSVPLNPELGERELAHVLSDSEPDLVLATSDGAMARTPGLERLRVRVDASSDAPEVRAREVDDEPILVLYTSGTTGAPKGAVITARNVAANLDGLAEAWAWTRADTVVHALPLFHVHGLVLGLFGSMRVGGGLHWVPRFLPNAIASALAGGGTMLFAVPTMYHRLADAALESREVRDALAGARLLVSGSAGLPLREHRRIEEATGRSVIERYGLTETLIDTAVRHDAPRPGYVGTPVPGVELRLVDEARTPLDVWDDATIGEVAVRGANVFAGYLHREDATRAVMDEEGWFHTGDLATRAADGQIRIVGRRATDLIKTGGFKVGAGEIEAVLLEHEGVAEVAVVGVPDEDLGERIVAFVVPRDPGRSPSADALIARVAGALAAHKRPREVRFVTELPRNAMGKVLKRRLLEDVA
jgi:malonyl-CoA/methylmalonyl-CoA synthetase